MIPFTEKRRTEKSLLKFVMGGHPHSLEVEVPMDYTDTWLIPNLRVSWGQKEHRVRTVVTKVMQDHVAMLLLCFGILCGFLGVYVRVLARRTKNQKKWY